VDTKTLLASRPIQLNDLQVPSRLDSIKFWREILSGNVPEYKWVAPLLKTNGYAWGGSHADYINAQSRIYGTDYCGFCDGAGTRTDEFGYYYCLCWLLDNASSLKASCYAWGSEWAPQLLSDLKLDKNTPDGTRLLEKAIARTEEWIQYPDKWLVYSGPCGTGKTHMLNAIMGAWFPYAMYVVASDFEDRLRRYLNEDNNQIQRYLDGLMHHPILVFDDIGMEYSTNWITAKLDAVIEYRSRKSHWWDTLTICGTNIRQKDIKGKFIRDEVSRIGSRLSDFKIVDWEILAGTDQRTRV